MPEGGTIPLARSGSGRRPARGRAALRREDPRRALATRSPAPAPGSPGAARTSTRPSPTSALRLPTSARRLQAAVSRPGAIAAIVARRGSHRAGLRGSPPRRRRRADRLGQRPSSARSPRTRPSSAEAVELLRPFEDELVATAPLADAGAAPTRRTAVAAAARRREALAKALPEINRVLALGDQIRSETGAAHRGDQPGARGRGAGDRTACTRPSPRSTRCSARCGRLVDGVAPVRRRHRPPATGHRRGDEQRRSTSARRAREASALRFAPVLTCHKARDPYPEPGETLEHSSDAESERMSERRRRVLGIAMIAVAVAGLIVAVIRPDPVPPDRTASGPSSTTSTGSARSTATSASPASTRARSARSSRVGDDALVELEVNDDVVVHADAQVALRPHTLFEGSAFVDLHPGSPSAPQISDGATIPRRHTRVYVSFDEALRVLHEPVRRAPARAAARAAARRPAARRPQALQRTLRAAPGADPRRRAERGARSQGSSGTELAGRDPRRRADDRRARPPRELAATAGRARRPHPGRARRRRRRPARPGARRAARPARDAARPRRRDHRADRPQRRARHQAAPALVELAPALHEPAADPRRGDAGDPPRGAAGRRDRDRDATGHRRGAGARAAARHPAPRPGRCSTSGCCRRCCASRASGSRPTCS